MNQNPNQFFPHRLGIGIGTPQQTIDVMVNGAACTGQLTAYSGTAATTSSIILRRAKGTAISPTGTVNGDVLGEVAFHGYTSTGVFRSGARFQVKANETWSGTIGGARLLFASVDAGSTSLTSKFAVENALFTVFSSFLVGGLSAPADSTTLIQFQDTAGTVWLNFDSTTGRFGLGSGNTSPTEVLDVIGNIKLSAAGNGIKIKEGSNATMGAAVLVLGTKTVSTTAVTANSRIFLQAESLGTITSPVALAVTARTAGTSFTITSANLTDTSTVAWIIIEPA